MNATNNNNTPNKNTHILRKKLSACMGSDRFRLRSELQQLERKPDDERLQRWLEKVDASAQRRARRLQNVPKPEYPDDLPVAQRRDEIIKAIQEHQVIVICGETGSGKTTQLPKMCLDAGRGVDGYIGHTQPRRIAARSVADRIAEELKSPMGQQVGYKVRFTDKTHKDSYVKLMTDGILLAEIQNDRFLNDYDTLIIDEAHERSLNIDFLMGYLRWLLPKRRDMKVIITSATIDPQRFSDHFDKAPIIEVSGRTFPVEIRYRPLVDVDGEDERDQTEAILEAVDELCAEGSGDILVFLPGEREIREAAEELRKHHPPATEILPLYARLSAEEQHRVFEAHGGRRRVVLATNVAETSLTVPGIKYVVDGGHARISRYSWRAGVQRLPIEKISQASANQRSGRCGRVSSGIAIRLYSEDDYNSRSAFTEPEILRTNLASVILQMEIMQLGDIDKFPFVEAPDIRLIRDGYKLLFEVGAVNEDFNLTPIGHTLAKLPVDPRLGRMLMAAEKEGALKEVLIIAAALALQDPRERPMEKQQAADEKHARFKTEESDFLAYLKLWDYFHEQRKALSTSQFRKLCKKEFLSWTRLQEWSDIHYQIRSTLLETGMKENEKEADLSGIHRSLLSGLLGNIGLKDEDREYQSANGRKFMIFPGSNLFKKSPQWVMAAELVETTKLYARTVGKIQPEWVEEFGAHLLKRHYTEPHWEEKPANVAAFERTSLYGITITPKRKVSYGRIDPVMSREIFIRHALVYGEYKTSAKFFEHNLRLVAEIEELEAKGRRRDILADETLLYTFFEPLIPPQVVNGASFEKWRKQAEQKNPRLLFLTHEYLMQRDAGHEKSGQFPDSIAVQGMILPLRYHFDPTANDDGVTVRVPLLALNQLSPVRFEYLVPGMLEEKMTALIRGLPKQVRKQFVPAPDYARACMDAIQPSEQVSLTDALGKQLLRMSGSRVEPELWQEVILPEHLRMRFELVDDAGVVVKAGRDLQTLRGKVSEQAQQELIRQPTHLIEKQGLTEWNFGDLPETHLLDMGGMKLHAWPALIAPNPASPSVEIKLFDNETNAHAAHRLGVLRLCMLALPVEVRDVPKQVSGMQQLCLHYAATGKCDELKDGITRYAFRQAFAPYLDNRHQAGFQTALAAGRKQIFVQAKELSRLLSPALATYHDIRRQLKGKVQPTWLEALNDINDQLAHLVFPGFLDVLEPEELRHLPRYLKGIQRRLERLAEAPAKDRALRVQVQPYWDKYKDRAGKGGAVVPDSASLREYRWMIEEFRISLFAQELGTAKPVSAKRLDKLWGEV